MDWQEYLKQLLASPSGAEITAHARDEDGTVEKVFHAALSRDVRFEDDITWLRPLCDPDTVVGYVNYFDLEVYRPRGHQNGVVTVDETARTVTFENDAAGVTVIVSPAGENAASIIDDFDEWVDARPSDEQDDIHALIP